MTPVSLMPPVDHCSSCEGRKAENVALQIGEARAQQAELQSATDPALTPAPGAPPPAEAVTGDGAQSVAGAVQPLLAPDLAVQASLAGSSIETAGGDPGGGGAAEVLRLRAAQAYRAA